MSESTEKDDAPEPFSALSFENPHDPDTLSLSDSDPALSDEAEVESVSAEEEEDEDDDDDDEEDNNIRQEGRPAPPFQPFSLKGTDATFSQRSHGIFGALLDVQKCSPLSQYNIKGKQGVTASLDPEVPVSNSNPPEQKEKLAVRSNTGSASVTTKKRSSAAAHLPDYLAHPERWTKYSLEDVPDTSDQVNRNTALNFLEGLKNQNEGKEVPKDATKPRSYNQDSSSAGEGRILFTKPQNKSQKDSEKSGAQSGQQHMAGSWADDGLEDPEGFGEMEKSQSLGFGTKKRSRKNIRPKADDIEEEDSS